MKEHLLELIKIGQLVMCLRVGPQFGAKPAQVANPDKMLGIIRDIQYIDSDGHGPPKYGPYPLYVVEAIYPEHLKGEIKTFGELDTIPVDLDKILNLPVAVQYGE